MKILKDLIDKGNRAIVAADLGDPVARKWLGVAHLSLAMVAAIATTALWGLT